MDILLFLLKRATIFFYIAQQKYKIQTRKYRLEVLLIKIIFPVVTHTPFLHFRHSALNAYGYFLHFKIPALLIETFKSIILFLKESILPRWFRPILTIAIPIPVVITIFRPFATHLINYIGHIC